MLPQEWFSTVKAHLFSDLIFMLFMILKMTLIFIWTVQQQSEDKKSISIAADAPSDTSADASEPIRALKPEAHDTVSQSSFSIGGDRGQPSTPLLQPERCAESTSPPKTPSSVSLAESVQSASHSESTTHCIPAKTPICSVLLRDSSACIINPTGYDVCLTVIIRHSKYDWHTLSQRGYVFP